MIAKFNLFENENPYFFIGDLTREQKTKIINELGYSNFELVFALNREQKAVLNVGDGKIVKLTIDKAEAMNANVLRQYNAKYIANYYDVREITFDGKSNAYQMYAIVMDRLIPLNDDEMNIYKNLMHYNMDELNIDYSNVWEMPTEDEIWKWNVDRESLNDIFEGHNKIVKECKKLKIPADDLHYGNVAWIDDILAKDRVLVGFDFGVYQTDRKYKTLKRINLVNNNKKINETLYIGNLYLSDKQMKKILWELGYTDYKYIDEGAFGVALDVGDDKVLKLTTDEDEATNCNLLRKYNTKHIVNYYDVREIEGDIWEENRDDEESYEETIERTYTRLFSVVMDKVEPFDDLEKYIFNMIPEGSKNTKMWIKNHMDVVEEQLERYKTSWDNNDNTTLEEFIALYEIIMNGYNDINEECKKLKIPVDDLHSENIGWRHGIVVGFDFGLRKTDKKHKSLKKIII
jgi:hypothetical protein